jgi:peptide/nickel transport system permease protein
MLLMIARRLAALPFVLLGVAVVTFVVVYMSPFDPVRALVGAESLVGPEVKADIARVWGLDRPLPERMLRWLGNIVRGDLGASIVAGGKPVSQVIGERLVPTVALAASAMALVLSGGLLIGVAAAAFRDSWFDWLVRGASYFSIAAPSFWVALLALFIFAVWLGWLPGAGASDPRAIDAPRIDPRHLVLPMTTLALTQFAWFAMFVRNTLLEVMQEDYIRYAQAQGLGRAAILFRHALPNALIPFVVLAGIHVGELVGGSVIIETIFGWPGLGAVTVEAALGADIPLLTAITLMGSAVIVLGNLLSDVSYRLIDPRVREALT